MLGDGVGMTEKDPDDGTGAREAINVANSLLCKDIRMPAVSTSSSDVLEFSTKEGQD